MRLDPRTWFGGEDDSGDGDEEACGHHHFGEHHYRSSFRLDGRTAFNLDSDNYGVGSLPSVGVKSHSAPASANKSCQIYAVQQKYAQHCEHHGCTESRTGWTTLGYLTLEDLLELPIEDSEDAAMEALDL